MSGSDSVADQTLAPLHYFLNSILLSTRNLKKTEYGKDFIQGTLRSTTAAVTFRICDK